jgi:dipeptidyl aminopeptidase/acylaminoacyl peptidase
MRTRTLHLIAVALCALALVAGLRHPPERAAAAPGTPALAAPLLLLDTPLQEALILRALNGSERRLALGSGLHRAWGFSPDGCDILLTYAAEEGAERLYRMRLDGTDVRPLVQYDPAAGSPPLATGWAAWEPVWSPDASRIAFTLIEYLPPASSNPLANQPRARTAWVPADGGEVTFYSVSGDEYSPRWSPDGAWLAYMSYETARAEDGTPLAREADLWVVSADAQRKYRLTAFPSGSVSLPRWSPDGDLIGFVYAPSGNNDQLWMIGNAEGALPTQLSYAGTLVIDLDWLPDSSAMLAAMREMQGIAEGRLWRIPLIGNADVDAALYDADAALAHANFPRFSADARYLALRAAYQLVIVDTETGSRQFFTEYSANTPPHWSPPAFTSEAACAVERSEEQRQPISA